MLQALPFTYCHIAEDADRAIPLLEQALALETDYAAAHAALAWCYHFRFRLRLKQEDRALAVRHARTAIAHGADDPTALGIAGFVVALDEHDQATALSVFDRALTLGNSNIFALCCGAQISNCPTRAPLSLRILSIPRPVATLCLDCGQVPPNTLPSRIEQLTPLVFTD